jgi:hypothetical protein
MMNATLRTGLIAASLVMVAADAEKPAFRAGVASRVITPAEPMWMAGYASRNKPSEGKVHELFAKALAVEDSSGGKVVLVTTDLVGLPRDLAEAVAATVRDKTGLPRERLMLTSSHTHCGPVIRSTLNDMYDMPPDEWKKVEAYTKRLPSILVEVVTAALDDLKPAKLSIGGGTARFALNRREATPKGVVIGRNPEGPVDHDAPVLRVESPDGKLRAVVFGYACHNTTLSFFQWCGDYAGFAQAELEKAHPGALAMFWIGCGADANPNPRGTVELCEKHGRELAEAVDAVLSKPMTPLSGPVTARYGTVTLPFDQLPGRQKWSDDGMSKQAAVRNRAARFLKAIDAGGKVPDRYADYPVQVWRFGDGLTWVALGGEVVVDYDLRLKREIAAKPLWVTAYANDVMAYIPSERVLKEGGYEADSSMIYYGMPTKWAPGLEDVIIRKTVELSKPLPK